MLRNGRLGYFPARALDLAKNTASFNGLGRSPS